MSHTADPSYTKRINGLMEQHIKTQAKKSSTSQIATRRGKKGIIVISPSRRSPRNATKGTSKGSAPKSQGSFSPTPSRTPTCSYYDQQSSDDSASDEAIQEENPETYTYVDLGNVTDFVTPPDWSTTSNSMDEDHCPEPDLRPEYEYYETRSRRETETAVAETYASCSEEDERQKAIEEEIFNRYMNIP